jgi:nitrite reductase/ring-hydroxylating ferredoxin subunit
MSAGVDPVLAPAAYCDGAWFQQEKRTVFAREWLPFCAAGQLAGPGAFVQQTLGGWPLFAIRGQDGAIRAFRNVCRHQGMPVLDKTAGQCDQLRCRFHGWTYDLAGRLVAAPPVVAPPVLESERHRLEAVELAEIDGIVSLRQERQPGAEAPDPLGVDGRPLGEVVTTDLDANWKTVVELLVETEPEFRWPAAFVRDAGPVRIVRQIVPRTFTRTRMIDLLFAAAEATAKPAAEEIRREAEPLKQAAVALNRRHAAGDAPPPPDAVLAFRRRLAAACAE